MISAEATPHLPSLVERFDGQTIGTDVDDSAQLEPICGVGRPHRLSIIHFTAEEEKQENNQTPIEEEQRMTCPSNSTFQKITKYKDYQINILWRCVCIFDFTLLLLNSENFIQQQRF